ncbi:hypothetical protein NDA01_20050 [Trichocoleus desertorum AS-A10]|uniref:hypothetical protein n=1 Tax=Trichocoleus desertorum TaxID=1481672 RepID=UPI00329A5EF4
MLTAHEFSEQSNLRSPDWKISRGRSPFYCRAKVLRLVDAEATRLETRLSDHARLPTQDKISVAEFQLRIAEDVKLSHLRMAAFVAGGEKQLNARHFGTAGQKLRRQYKHLQGFGDAVAQGELSEKQILARAKSYGVSARTAFFKSEKLTRVSYGAREAKRSLDIQSRHCSSCLGHSTGGLWFRIDQVVAPGVDCECQSRCRCRIVRESNPKAAMLRVAQSVPEVILF